MMSLRSVLSAGRVLVRRQLPRRSASSGHGHGEAHAEHGHGHGHGDSHMPEWERRHLELLSKSPKGWEPPNGFLFNEKPGPRKWQWWEGHWYFGYYLPLAAFIVLAFSLPDPGLRTWARLTALERLAEKEGKAEESAADE